MEFFAGVFVGGILGVVIMALMAAAKGGDEAMMLFMTDQQVKHDGKMWDIEEMTDKNGKKIFEGDIVVVPLSGKPAKGIIKYFKTDICGFTVITQPQYSNYVLQKNCAYEVIGNIHDNPELLEV